MVEIKLDEAQMREFVQAALMKTIDEKTRDALISNAIEQLLRQEGNRRDGSQLQRIWNDAIEHFARQEVNKLLTTNEVLKAKLADLCTKALTKAIEQEDDMVNNLAKVLADAIRVPSRY